MGLERQIKMIFTEPFKENHIKYIATNGISLGCVFFDDNINNRLSIDQITNIFYEGYKIAGYGGSLSVNNDSSLFSISIYQETQNNAALSLHFTCNYWRKSPSNPDCDFERYIRLLLGMTADMPLKSISIEYSP